MAAGLVALLLALPGTASAGVVAEDDHVCDIFALRGMVFYTRAAAGPLQEENYCGWAERRYGRVVDGRRQAVTGLPEDAHLVTSGAGSSIGLDRRGRVVVTVTDGSRWWLYDVAADVSRRVRPPTGGCRVSMLATWKAQLAFGRSCDPASPGAEGYFLLDGGPERRLADGPWAQWGNLALRRGTVAFAGIDDGDDVSAGRLADRGRACPKLFFYGSAWGTTPREAWVQRGRILLEVGGVPDGGSNSWNWKDSSLWEIELGRPCSALDEPRKLFTLPGSLRAQAVAVAGEDLYYADDAAIRQRPLDSFR